MGTCSLQRIAGPLTYQIADYFRHRSTSLKPSIKHSKTLWLHYPTDRRKKHTRMLYKLYLRHCRIHSDMIADVLLRFYRQLWRICLQSSDVKLYTPEPYGFIGRDRHKVLACSAKGHQKHTLLREDEELPLQRIPGSNNDGEWCC